MADCKDDAQLMGMMLQIVCNKEAYLMFNFSYKIVHLSVETITNVELNLVPSLSNLTWHRATVSAGVVCQTKQTIRKNISAFQLTNSL